MVDIALQKFAWRQHLPSGCGDLELTRAKQHGEQGQNGLVAPAVGGAGKALFEFGALVGAGGNVGQNLQRARVGFCRLHVACALQGVDQPPGGFFKCFGPA